MVGAAGMLGREVVGAFGEDGWEVAPLTRAELDITDPVACRGAVEGADVVVNGAAWTAVDAAEEHEPAAFAVNALGPASLARACSGAGARLVHVSTDYVFAGDAAGPYAEEAVTAPRSAYGRTKLAGEWAVTSAGPEHMVLRTAWLYGDGGCFPRTIARLLSEREEISVVDDQRGQPTWTVDVADLALRLVRAGAPGGTYHATAGGATTWCDFAREVASAVGADRERVRATSTDAFPRPAPRPASSVLGHARLGEIGVDEIGDWASRWKVAVPSVLPGPR